MYAAHLLEKNECEIKKLFNQYPQLGDTDPKALGFKQIADNVPERIKIARVILRPAAHRSGLQPSLKEIVGEHLSVKRVIRDLFDMICEEEGYIPKLNALPEPGTHPVEEVEQEVSSNHAPGETSDCRLPQPAPAGWLSPPDVHDDRRGLGRVQSGRTALAS